MEANIKRRELVLFVASLVFCPPLIPVLVLIGSRADRLFILARENKFWQFGIFLICSVFWTPFAIHLFGVVNGNFKLGLISVVCGVLLVFAYIFAVVSISLVISDPFSTYLGDKRRG